MQRLFLSSLVLGSVILGVSPSRAQNGHGGQKDDEAAAPANCGVLGVCGEKIFMYSCQAENVVVRRCGEGSSYKIENQKNCVGPERKISKADFRNFIKAQLDKTELHGRFGAISKDDLWASKSTGDVSDAKIQQEKLVRQIENLRNKVQQMDPAYDDANGKAALAKIQKELSSLEGCLASATVNVFACKNKDAAISKINVQIDEAVNKICSKNGIHIPKSGEFLHTVLSQYDPSKHPCRDEKECAQEVKLKDGKVVGTVVARAVNPSGVVEEYVKDKASQLVWGPEASTGGKDNDGTMTFQEASKYCEGKKDFGLRWSLPSKNEFIVAFNPTNSIEPPSNPEKDPFIYNKTLLEVLELKDRKTLWSSTLYRYPIDAVEDAWAFNHDGSIVRGNLWSPGTVRCVGRQT